MTYDPALRCSEEECHALFAWLFPQGLAGDDVMRELAPEGWAQSPLSRVFHPTPEQVFEESARIRENLSALASKRAREADARPSEPPSLERIRAEHRATPYEPERELRDLVGMCLWDTFSDNHEVTGPDGRVFDLGSFRASGGFLAEVVNRELGHAPGAAEAQEMARLKSLIGMKSVEDIFAAIDAKMAQPAENRIYDYMDFYMGTQSVASRTDLTPVYRMIFRRLRALDCDWVYHFPKLLLVDMRPLRDAMKEQAAESPEWEEYNPSAAFEQAEGDRERDEELSSMRAQMDESHREAVAAAQESAPPTTVRAYRDVYGEFPEGWPPQAEN
jgi:hypothetical protein